MNTQNTENTEVIQEFELTDQQLGVLASTGELILSAEDGNLVKVIESKLDGGSEALYGGTVFEVNGYSISYR